MQSIGRCAAGLALLALIPVTGCHHNTNTASAPPPPPISAQRPPRTSDAPVQPALDAAATAVSDADLQFVASHQPIYSESGLASWYGPPYHNRRGANGQLFDQNALTAAHRTLPMNSLIRVTNLTTNQSAVVRVTDRGPFVQGRLLDLSLASAKAIGVWRPGVAKVRVEVFQAPLPIDDGGRWCVQVGAFKDGDEAVKLRDHLLRKYHTANVIEFTGPTGHWVRIRPQNDDKGRALEIANELKPAEGDAYLVRLD